jgi:hypothetical protein
VTANRRGVANKVGVGRGYRSADQQFVEDVLRDVEREVGLSYVDWPRERLARQPYEAAWTAALYRNAVAAGRSPLPPHPQSVPQPSPSHGYSIHTNTRPHRSPSDDVRRGTPCLS